MAQKKALVAVTVPGFLGQDEWRLDFEDHPVMFWMKFLLKKHKIEHHRCDNMPGWWNLNQDWIEFVCDVETDWSWVKPLFLRDDEWNKMFVLLTRGDLIMQVRYKVEENGKTEYIPHC